MTGQTKGRGARTAPFHRARSVVLVTVVAAVCLGAAAPDAGAAIVSRGVSTTRYASDSTTSLTLPVPPGAQAGDVLVASLGFGKSGAKKLPSLTAPAGWSLATRTNQGLVASLAVYWHVLAAGESSYTWTTDVSVGGVVFLAAFGGVDTARPLDVSAGIQSGAGTSVTAPSVSTTAASDLLVAGYFGYNGKAVGTSWSPAPGMTELGDGFNSTASRSASIDYGVQAASGPTGSKPATASARQDYGLGVLSALRAAETGPVDTTPPVVSGVGVGSVGSTSATVSWVTDEPSDSLVEYGLTSGYGSSSGLDATLRSSHSVVLGGLSPDTTYHYRVKSADASGNVATSADSTFQTAPASTTGGPQDSFDGNAIDPARWAVASSGSTVAATNQELEITHAPGAWTKGTIQSRTPHDQTGKSLQLQVKRAANGGSGGSTYGETSVFLSVDSTHSVEFFIAGGSLTAWVNNGSTETNLTPSWPRYDAVNMRWLRFRESAGTLYWEYAAGTSSPGAWTRLAAIASPFPLTAVTLEIVAGSNVASTDTAAFDDISTY